MTLKKGRQISHFACIYSLGYAQKPVIVVLFIEKDITLDYLKFSFLVALTVTRQKPSGSVRGLTDVSQAKISKTFTKTVWMDGGAEHYGQT